MKYLVVLSLLLFFGLESFSQDKRPIPAETAATQEAFKEKMFSIFEHVDLSQVKTGILKERGFGYFSIEKFDGTLSSEKSSLMAFGLSYATISNMIINERMALADPSSYRRKLDKNGPESEFILVAGLHEEYETIDTLAAEKGLFNVINEQLFDVANRTESPYLKRDLFLFAPSTTFILGSELKLKFDSELFYTNSSKTIQSLEVNMDNGLGYVKQKMDKIISASYQEAGAKNIKVRLKYTDGSVLYSHFDIVTDDPKARDSESAPDFTKYIYHLAGDLPADGRAPGHIYTYLACGHSEITKPFIWAEGFNPKVGNLDLRLSKEQALERLSTEDTKIGNVTLKTYLEDNGYDIIILDYDDGGDYLPRISEFIKTSINWVNTQKHNAGSNEKNIIIGQSMGGVCTNLALKEMELANIDHEVGTFIIFDSPIMGVNIPLSGQAAILDIAHLPIYNPLTPFQPPLSLKNYVTILDDAYNLLRKPAARTMISYLDPMLPDPSLWHSHYYKQHNVLGGMPTQCEILTITNGSNAGASGKQPFNAGDLIMHSNINNFHLLAHLNRFATNANPSSIGPWTLTPAVVALGSFIAWTGGVNVVTDIKLYAVPGNSSGVYYSSFFHASVLNIDITLSANQRNISWISNIMMATDIDCAPGGFVGPEAEEPLFIQTMLANMNFQLLQPQEFKLQTWCFTPTVSVLNYHSNPNNNLFYDLLHDFQNNTAELNANNPKDVDNYCSNSLGRISTIPLNGYPGQNVPYKNSAHTWFTNESSGFLLYHLVGSNLLGNMSQLNWPQTFNYSKRILNSSVVYNHNGVSTPRATRSVLDHDLTVSNTILGVNAPIAFGLYTPGPGSAAAPALNSSFSMQLGYSCTQEGPVTLVIDNGAQLIIGDGSTRIGSVIVNDNHKIVVRNGGKIIINKKGALILNGNGKLILEEGATLINNGQLRLNDQSILAIEQNVTIDMFNDNTEIVFNGGNLEMRDNALFTFNHPSSTGGLVRVKKDTEVYSNSSSNTNCVFRLDGNHEWKALLIVEKDATLLVNSAVSGMHQMKIYNGGVRLFENSKIQCESQFFVGNARIVNQGSDHTPRINLFQKSQISSTSIVDVVLDVDLVNCPVADGLKLLGCDVQYDYENYAIRVKSGKYLMYNCDFNLSHVNTPLAIHGYLSSQPSSISKCLFMGTTLSRFVHDQSNVRLNINDSEFTNGFTGIWKENGLLKLRCSEFNNLKTGVLVDNGAELDMTAGYNTFNSMLHASIHFNAADNPSIASGYNGFSKGSNTNKIFSGLIGTNLTQIDGTKNGWYPWNANASNFLVTNGFSQTVGTTTTSPQQGNCGVFDDQTGTDNPNGGGNSSSLILFNDNTSPLIVLKGMNDGNPETFASLYQKGLSAQDGENADYLGSLNIFHKLVVQDYSEYQIDEVQLEAALDFVLNRMKYTMHDALENSSDIRFNNQYVMLYTDALNAKSKYLENEGNDLIKFYHEIEKVHLFEQMNKPSTALSIIDNIELCVLDSNEQSLINFLKFNLQERLAQIAYGPGAIYLDTVFTNTSKYTQPVKRDDVSYNFSSFINQNGDVTFTGNCDPRSFDQAVEEHNQFLVYPNPTSSILNVQYKLEKNKSAQYRLTGIDGKVVLEGELSHERELKTIDISHLQSGIYILTQIKDGQTLNTVKVSKL